jgi:hypothetical protein
MEIKQNKGCKLVALESPRFFIHFFLRKAGASFINTVQTRKKDFTKSPGED